MEKYVWLFPIIFVFHDMEEIIGFGIWLKRNKKFLDEKFPSVTKTYRNFSTEGFALAVFEEFVLCLLVCIIAIVSDNKYIWYIWLGGLLACTLHFVIHIVQSLVVRMYIPALITSILCLPVSTWILYQCILTISDRLMTVVVFAIL